MCGSRDDVLQTPGTQSITPVCARRLMRSSRMNTSDNFSGSESSDLKEALNQIEHYRDGLSFSLDLNKKMGMVINPNLEVSKVFEAGQSESGGVRPGCMITSVGGSKVSSIEDLKCKIDEFKAEGRMEIMVTFIDPRKIAFLASEIARIRAALSAEAAMLASIEEEEAHRRADEEGKVAECLARVHLEERQKAADDAVSFSAALEEGRRKAKSEQEMIAASIKLKMKEAEEHEMARVVASEKARAAARADAEAKAAAAAEAANNAKLRAEHLAREKSLEVERATLRANKLQKDRDEAVVKAQLGEHTRLQWLAASILQPANEWCRVDDSQPVDARPGQTEVKLCIVQAKGLPPSERHGLSDGFAYAEVVDLMTDKPIEPTRKFRTLQCKRTLAPFWTETVVWPDIPFPSHQLAVRVKVMDADDSKGFITAIPLGQVTLPLSAMGANMGKETWWTLGQAAKMQGPASGALEVVLTCNDFKRFNCSVCGRISSKKHMNVCRACGAVINRKPNENITKDDGSSTRVKALWLERRKSHFEIKREPLVIPTRRAKYVT